MSETGAVLTMPSTESYPKEDTSISKPVSSSFSPSQTLIFLDWDDTLLPSSWVTSMGLRLEHPAELPADVTSQLQTLENSVIHLINLANQVGTACIITNAETGWVELSCQRFMPRVYPYLSKVKVLSARSTYEKENNNPSEWKRRAFEYEIRRCFPDGTLSKRNILSLGDSLHEREAVHRVTKYGFGS